MPNKETDVQDILRQELEALRDKLADEQELSVHHILSAPELESLVEKRPMTFGRFFFFFDFMG